MKREITPNEFAFLQISEEYHKINNSLQVLDKFATVVSRLDSWTKQKLGEIDPDKVMIQDMEGFARVLPYLADDGDTLRRKQAVLNKRVKELSSLMDTYLRGGDIVVAKLSRE